MSDSPNRASDFGTGVLVGILLVIGAGGLHSYTKFREQQAAEERARLECIKNLRHGSWVMCGSGEENDVIPDMLPATDRE
jgi:hypothetical protein